MQGRGEMHTNNIHEKEKARKRRQNKQTDEQTQGEKNRKRSERNIPRSEGFEICFCLKVSERENREQKKKEREKGESTDRGTQSRTPTYRKSGERKKEKPAHYYDMNKRDNSV